MEFCFGVLVSAASGNDIDVCLSGMCFLLLVVQKKENQLSLIATTYLPGNFLFNDVSMNMVSLLIISN